MARVLALTADLLFGSRLVASLTAAGHDVQLVAGEAELLVSDDRHLHRLIHVEDVTVIGPAGMPSRNSSCPLR